MHFHGFFYFVLFLGREDITILFQIFIRMEHFKVSCNLRVTENINH